MDRASGDAVAALDCGTNSTRLLIRAPGRPDVREMRITRLGQGVDATGALDSGAIARTLTVLGTYREQMERHGVGRARLVATSAVRDAANGEEFLRAATEAAGVRAELLDGSAEGALAFAGATAALDARPEDVVIIDIGGGSTELVMGGTRVEAISLDLGCVRLTERCLRSEPPTPAELADAVRAIHTELDRAANALGGLTDPGHVLVGVAGTVSTLGALAQGLSHYDRDRIHHFVLELGVVTEWCDRLAALTATARAGFPGIAPGREDVIVGGALVLRETMRRFSFDRCVVSESDLLDGIAMSLQGG
jgi:exopolyphosphatase / guanosine-5'-triphosphate,3'-diphosphate pyrophosphatase